MTHNFVAWKSSYQKLAYVIYVCVVDVALQAAASELEGKFPAIDVLINNAGILSEHVPHLEMCVPIILTACISFVH